MNVPIRKLMIVTMTFMMVTGMMPALGMAAVSANEQGTTDDNQFTQTNDDELVQGNTVQVQYRVNNGPEYSENLGSTISFDVAASNPSNQEVTRNLEVVVVNQNTQEKQIVSTKELTFAPQENKDTQLTVTLSSENFNANERYVFYVREAGNSEEDYNEFESNAYISTIIDGTGDTTEAELGGQVVSATGDSATQTISYASRYNSGNDGELVDITIPTENPQGTVEDFAYARGLATFNEEQSTILSPNNDGNFRTTTSHAAVENGDKQTLVVTYMTDETKEEMNINIVNANGEEIDEDTSYSLSSVDDADDNTAKTYTVDLSEKETQYVNDQHKVFVEYEGSSLSQDYLVQCQAVVTDGHAPASACTGQEQVNNGLYLSYTVDKTAVLSGDVVEVTPTLQNTLDEKQSYNINMKRQTPSSDEYENLFQDQGTIDARQTIALKSYKVSMVEPGTHTVTLGEASGEDEVVLDGTDVRVSGAQGVPKFSNSYNLERDVYSVDRGINIKSKASEISGTNLNGREVKNVVTYKAQNPSEDSLYMVEQRVVNLESGETKDDNYNYDRGSLRKDESRGEGSGYYTVTVNDLSSTTVQVDQPPSPRVTNVDYNVNHNDDTIDVTISIDDESDVESDVTVGLNLETKDYSPYNKETTVTMTNSATVEFTVDYNECQNFDATTTVTSEMSDNSDTYNDYNVDCNNAPNADADVPSNTDEGDTESFDAYGSSDSDGNIVDYRWEVDGSYVGSGETESYTFNDAGNHDVTLIVTDDDGEESRETHTVDVDSTSSGGGWYSSTGGSSTSSSSDTTNNDGGGSTCGFICDHATSTDQNYGSTSDTTTDTTADTSSLSRGSDQGAGGGTSTGAYDHSTDSSSGGGGGSSVIDTISTIAGPLTNDSLYNF